MIGNCSILLFNLTQVFKYCYVRYLCTTEHSVNQKELRFLQQYYIYTGSPKITGAYPYTLNGLLNQYYTSTKPIIIFFVDDENLFLPFSKEGNVGPLIFKYHPLSCDK